MLVLSPIVIFVTSPRKTQPYQIPEFLPIVVAPEIIAVWAMKADESIVGRMFR
jgi:hypothetical protein